MLVTGAPPTPNQRRRAKSAFGGLGSRGPMGGSDGGFVPPESLGEKLSSMIDHCHKKIRLLHAAPSSLFTSLVT